MHKTGIEDHFIIKGSQKLRCGYTTGTCAAAAAKAAALMLFSGHRVSKVRLRTPKGIELELIPEDIVFDYETGTSVLLSVSCAVRKDAGDDPDVTDGILVYAAVSRIDPHREGMILQPHSQASETIVHSKPQASGTIFNPEPENEAEGPFIHIDGGTGVGRVTREGLQQKVGEAAINPVPKQMILQEVLAVCRDFEYTNSLYITISIPQGVELAKKTFNPRLGIEGGISVLGTSGIVVPMSESALIESIRLEMSMLHEAGCRILLVTPGNYGETFTKEQMTVDLSSSMRCSNYVGETLDMAVNMDVKGLLFVAHIGKFIKVAGGIMNTHSKEADARAELMAAFALRAGADRDCAMRILNSVTTDEALEIMEEAGVRQNAIALILEKIRYYLQHRCGGRIRTEAILFSGSLGYLGQTEGAGELLKELNSKAERAE